MTATKKETLVKIPTGDGPYVRAKHAQVILSDRLLKKHNFLQSPPKHGTTNLSKASGFMRRTAKLVLLNQF